MDLVNALTGLIVFGSEITLRKTAVFKWDSQEFSTVVVPFPIVPNRNPEYVRDKSSVELIVATLYNPYDSVLKLDVKLKIDQHSMGVEEMKTVVNSFLNIKLPNEPRELSFTVLDEGIKTYYVSVNLENGLFEQEKRMLFTSSEEIKAFLYSLWGL